MNKKSSSWEALSKKNNLTFVPGDFFESEYIEGLYRGYNLKMTHWNFGVEIILTLDENDWAVNKSSAKGAIKISHLITTPYLSKITQGYLRVENNGRKILYHHIQTPQNSKNNTKYFRRIWDLLCDLGDNYRCLFGLGGTAILVLEQEVANQPTLAQFAHQLLEDISNDTQNRFGSRGSRFICPKCLNRFGIHQVNLPNLLEDVDLKYIACRNCHQSQDYIESEVVVALLDSKAKARTFSDDMLEVNWLKRRKLFDFDAVKIIRATDEDVERFAIQVGNDTDVTRVWKYKQMDCLVFAGSGLSENTMRILRRMFGQVNIGVDE